MPAGFEPTSSRRFLNGLAEAARLTIHVRLIEGQDSQHVLEAIFKGLGVARARVADACRPSPAFKRRQQWLTRR